MGKKWSACSSSCGKGVATRKVVCRNGGTGKNVAAAYCVGAIPATQPCTLGACPDVVQTPPPVTSTVAPAPTARVDWIVGNWSACSTTCDKGNQIRSVTCSSNCIGPKPETERTCKLRPCKSVDTRGTNSFAN